MYRRVSIFSAIATAALVIAGCGIAKGAPGGKSPDTAVADALTQAQSTSLHATVTASLSVDRSDLRNLPTEIEGLLSHLAAGGTATAQIDQESAARRKASLQAGGKTITAVQYDGKAWYSEDGAHFTPVTEQFPMQSPLAGFDLSKLVSAFSFQDAGAETQDGRAVEHYSAPITVATLQTLATNLVGSGAQSSQIQQAIALAAPFATIDRGNIDVWLSSTDGSVVRVKVSGAVRVNVGGLASLGQSFDQAPASGTAPVTGHLGLTFEVDAHVSQAAGSVHVTRPSPDASAGSGGAPSAKP